jgi:hypothetical protein
LKKSCFGYDRVVLGNPANGNFLGQFELIAKNDPVIADHIQ